MMWTEEKLNALQTAPSDALIADMKKILDVDMVKKRISLTMKNI